MYGGARHCAEQNRDPAQNRTGDGGQFHPWAWQINATSASKRSQSSESTTRMDTPCGVDYGIIETRGGAEFSPLVSRPPRSLR